MAQPAVQFVEHPARQAFRRQQVPRAFDQVVKVQRPPPGLLGLIRRQRRQAELQERRGARKRLRAPQVRRQSLDPPRLTPGIVANGKQLRDNRRSVRHTLRERTFLARLPRRRQEDRRIKFKRLCRSPARQHTLQLFRQLQVGDLPATQRGNRAADVARRKVRTHRLRHKRIRRRIRRLDHLAQRLLHRVRIIPAVRSKFTQRPSRPFQRIQRAARPVPSRLARQQGEQRPVIPRRPQDRRLFRRLPDLPGIVFFQLREPRHHTGFQREPSQDPRTKCMDRLDPQAAGRFQSARKQRPRRLQLLLRIFL